MIDLHSHSTSSDGQHAPKELLRLAHEAGVRTLALTDHDTVENIAEAQAAAQALGISRQTLRTKLKEYALGDDTEEGESTP